MIWEKAASWFLLLRRGAGLALAAGREGGLNLAA